ncbi:MAG: hypothetical protein D3924_06200, partial [Candidatus Electrothrix sp. AR4]|nr:hypothetical protein [Candidatus Electrothrix sp. AR4]
MPLPRFNKKILCNTFFLSFLIVGIIPYSIVAWKLLRDVENQLTSSLNNQFHLIAKQITLQIDQANLLIWKTNISHLSEIITSNIDPAERNGLLDDFLRHSSDMLAIIIQSDDMPIYLLKDKLISQLSAYDAEGVAQLLTEPCTNQEAGLITVCAPVVIQLQDSEQIFLPMDLIVPEENGKTTRLRCVFQLSKVLDRIGKEARFGIDNQSVEIYIANSNGSVMYSGKESTFKVGDKLAYPLLDDVVES